MEHKTEIFDYNREKRRQDSGNYKINGAEEMNKRKTRILPLEIFEITILKKDVILIKK
jgi:hypothetical protein